MFIKVIRKLEKNSWNNVMTYVKGKVSDNSSGFNFQRMIRDGDNLDKGKGIQCFDMKDLDTSRHNATISFKRKIRDTLLLFQMKNMKTGVMKKILTM